MDYVVDELISLGFKYCENVEAYFYLGGHFTVFFNYMPCKSVYVQIYDNDYIYLDKLFSARIVAVRTAYYAVRTPESYLNDRLKTPILEGMTIGGWLVGNNKIGGF
jgi:hypothetical protein